MVAEPVRLASIGVSDIVTYANGDRSQYLDLTFRFGTSPVSRTRRTARTRMPPGSRPTRSRRCRDTCASAPSPRCPTSPRRSSPGDHHDGSRDRDLPVPAGDPRGLPACPVLRDRDRRGHADDRDPLGRSRGHPGRRGVLAALLAVGQILADAPAGALAARIGDRRALLLPPWRLGRRSSPARWPRSAGARRRGAGDGCHQLGLHARSAGLPHRDHAAAVSRAGAVDARWDGSRRFVRRAVPRRRGGVPGRDAAVFWLASVVVAVTGVVVVLVPDVRRGARRGRPVRTSRCGACTSTTAGCSRRSAWRCCSSARPAAPARWCCRCGASTSASPRRRRAWSSGCPAPSTPPCSIRRAS